jgi:hypothetical protein
MGKADKLIADMLIEHGINLLRFGAGQRARVLAILQSMELELTQMLVGGSITHWQRDRAMRLLKQTSMVISDYYDQLNGTQDMAMQGVAKISAAATARALGTAYIGIDVAMPTSYMLETLASNVLISGAPSKEWWTHQSSNTRLRFSNEVRQGIAQAETKMQIVARITGTEAKGGILGKAGVLDISKKDAFRLVHASVQTVGNAARRKTFEANPDVVTGVRQVSTLDGHTSEICLAYSGATFAIIRAANGDISYRPSGDTKLPYNGGTPRHWGCRSVETAILKTFAERGIDLPEFPTGQRASSVGPLPGNVTMDEYLSRKTAAQLDAQLGKGKADLYRRKVITLQQLLDQTGNPLSLAQLEALYA